MIITIDGPAGSGKSTAARKLAARLGIPYLDTGAMYRVVTLAALEAGVDLADEGALTAIAESDGFELFPSPTHIRVTLHGSDVTEAVRSMRVSDHTRFVAASPGVRRALIEKQRAIGRRVGSMVTEGRDQGSAAFPDADIKFYISADLDTRAERRFHELLADGESVTLDQVRANLSHRDDTDSTRAVAPLRQPPGAVVLDSTRMSIPEVIETLLLAIERAGLVAAPAKHRAPSASHP